MQEHTALVKCLPPAFYQVSIGGLLFSFILTVLKNKSIYCHLQETTVKQLQSPLPLPTTLPLLSASIASTKTVIANPVLYLNNHIHDILYTIVQMKTPPHPNVEDMKVM